LENTVLSMIEPDGSVHALSPDNLDVIDAERIDDHTVAFLAERDGARAIYTLSLAASRAVRLPAADPVLSTTRGPAPPRARAPVGHDAATPLASLRGNTTVIGAVRVGDRTWALVGHNVANYAGDFGELSTEADVCALPDSGEVSFATRNVPARYADKQQALFDA